MSTNDKFLEFLSNNLDATRKHLAGVCESPIEEMLVTGMSLALAANMPCGGRVNHGSGSLSYAGKWATEYGESGQLMVFTQVQIDTTLYRADAVIMYQRGFQNWWPVIVECDGHDFHERTKEQAAHDRQRDREMQRLGFPVLRYTGSEIYRDPMRCAISALEFAYDLQLDAVRSWLYAESNANAQEAAE